MPLGLPGPTHRLPLPLSSFVGRQEDLAALVTLVEGNRLVVLTGVGGCGKTRLALSLAMAVANRAVEGWTHTHWSGLEAITNPGDVVEAVAAAVGFASHPGLDPHAILAEHLGGATPNLLVLDNAEHLLEAVVGLVSELLARCPQLHVLVTSREPLGITGETVWRVPSLSIPPDARAASIDEILTYDSVRLFLERAKSVRPDLDWSADRDAARHVASICIGLDGLPLGIELAAARARALPLDVVARGIGNALGWRSSNKASPLGRHATLRACIAWSVELVAPDARSMLTRLAVFQSWFGFDAAVAVGGADQPAEDAAAALQALVDASLVEFDAGRGRYRMLQAVRQFHTLRPDARSELHLARLRHAEHFAAYCTEVGEGRHGIGRTPLSLEMPDIVAAKRWASRHAPALALDMCAGLGSVRSALGHHGDVADTWAWLMSQDRTGPDGDERCSPLWAVAVAATIGAATMQSIDVSRAVAELRCGLAPDANRARGWLTREAALGPAYQGRPSGIVAYLLDVEERRDDVEFAVHGGVAAYVLALMGRTEESAALVERLSRLARRSGSDFGVESVGDGFAAAVICDIACGDLPAARARASARVPDDPTFSMTAAAAIAELALSTGDHEVLACARRWSRRPTLPLWRFLPTFIDLVAMRLDGRIEAAAAAAERYWSQAAPVPVSRVGPLPTITSALLDAGRLSQAAEVVKEAAQLVSAMEEAPRLTAGLRVSEALMTERNLSIPGDAQL